MFIFQTNQPPFSLSVCENHTNTFDTSLTPRVPMVSGRLELVLHTCFLIQHMRYQNDLGLGMMLKGAGRVPPSSK